jgi:hypothetical protein
MNDQEMYETNKSPNHSVVSNPGVIRNLEAITQPFMSGEYGEVTGLGQFVQQGVSEDVFEKINLVAQRTEWTQPKLLDRIGVKRIPATDSSELDPELQEDCSHFLGLLVETVDIKANIPVKRATVTMLARLVIQTDLTAKALDEILRWGDPSPIEYMRFGETEQAARVARLSIGAHEPSDLPLTPLPAPERPAHISLPRLDAYLRGEQGAFGDDVSSAIGDHVHGCRSCSEAARHRRKRNSLSMAA